MPAAAAPCARLGGGAPRHRPRLKDRHPAGRPLEPCSRGVHPFRRTSAAARARRGRRPDRRCWPAPLPRRARRPRRRGGVAGCPPIPVVEADRAVASARAADPLLRPRGLRLGQARDHLRRRLVQLDARLRARRRRPLPVQAQGRRAPPLLRAGAGARVRARRASRTPACTFPDVDPDSPWHRFAAIAVERGWINVAPGGLFDPNEPRDDARRAPRARARARAAGPRPRRWTGSTRATACGSTLPRTLRDDAAGHAAGAPLQRAERQRVARRRARRRPRRAPRSRTRSTAPRRSPRGASATLRDAVRRHRAPAPGPAAARRSCGWGVDYVGYPYVWGGEWGLESQAPAGLGGQPRSGFDCSGLTWWLLRENDGGAWKVAPPRPYRGLVARRSAPRPTWRG